MLDTYRGGYKKALLDLRGLIGNYAFSCNAKSKKQFQRLVTSYINLVLSDPETFESVLETGMPEIMITKDCDCRPVREFDHRVKE